MSLSSCPKERCINTVYSKRICRCHVVYRGDLLLLILMLWHMQAIVKSKEDNLLSSGETRIRIQVFVKPILQQTECPLKNRLCYRGSSKNLNSLARPLMSELLSKPLKCQESHDEIYYGILYCNDLIEKIFAHFLFCL